MSCVQGVRAQAGEAGASGGLAFRPTPGCHTAVCTSDNGIIPITGAPPQSLHLGKGLGALRHEAYPLTLGVCVGARSIL